MKKVQIKEMFGKYLFNFRAITNLALLYADGLGVVKNEMESVNLFRIAAQKQHVRAQTKLAEFLLQGRGCKEDPFEAFMWFKTASELGSVPASFHVGDLYERGVGCEQNMRKAIEYYELAAFGGDTAASDRLIAIIANTSLLDNVIDCGHAAKAA
jgi:TPR repeat protein